MAVAARACQCCYRAPHRAGSAGGETARQAHQFAHTRLTALRGTHNEHLQAAIAAIHRAAFFNITQSTHSETEDGRAPNGPPFWSRFPEKVTHPDFKKSAKDRRCCFTLASRVRGQPDEAHDGLVSSELVSGARSGQCLEPG